MFFFGNQHIVLLTFRLKGRALNLYTDVASWSNLASSFCLKLIIGARTCQVRELSYDYIYCQPKSIIGTYRILFALCDVAKSGSCGTVVFVLPCCKFLSRVLSCKTNISTPIKRFTTRSLNYSYVFRKQIANLLDCLVDKIHLLCLFSNLKREKSLFQVKAE